MYTDEYLIALKKELSVCGSFIGKIEGFLAGMKNKYNPKTGEFIRMSGDAGGSKDYILWKDKCEELKIWKERESRYKEMLDLAGK